MKDEIMQRLSAVINALNTVTVCGKANLGYMGGSINVLEEVMAMLSNADVTEAKREPEGN